MTGAQRLHAPGSFVTGSIADSISGSQISTASVRIWRLAKPNQFLRMSVSHEFSVLIPPDTEVEMLIQAPGYDDWYYPGTAVASGTAALVVRSGDKYGPITVALVPKPH